MSQQLIGSIIGGGGSGGSGSISNQKVQQGVSYEEMRTLHVEINLLGYMSKFDIPKEQYPKVFSWVCEKIGQEMLMGDSNRAYGAHGMLTEICQKELPNFKFNNELEEVLDEK